MPRCLGGPILTIALLAPVYSQQSGAWRDPSPHTVRFVPVDEDVRLEVLDWGGSAGPWSSWPVAGKRRTYSTSSLRTLQPTAMCMARGEGPAHPGFRICRAERIASLTMSWQSSTRWN